jgi:hypothetical protein
MIRYYCGKTEEPMVYLIEAFYYNSMLHYEIFRDSWDVPTGGVEVTEENWIYKISNLADAIVEIVES